MSPQRSMVVSFLYAYRNYSFYKNCNYDTLCGERKYYCFNKRIIIFNKREFITANSFFNIKKLKIKN